MNYLGHAYFSPPDNGVLFGNFTGDFFRGFPENLNLPENIIKGIILHRKLDFLTDSNIYTKKLKLILDGKFRHFKLIIIDMLIDHFLAKNWKLFHYIPLKIFCEETYNKVILFEKYFPYSFKNTFERISTNNWLLNYKEKDVMGNVFHNISKKMKVKNNINKAFEEFTEKYKLLEVESLNLISDMKNSVDHI